MIDVFNRSEISINNWFKHAHKQLLKAVDIHVDADCCTVDANEYSAINRHLDNVFATSVAATLHSVN